MADEDARDDIWDAVDDEALNAFGMDGEVNGRLEQRDVMDENDFVEYRRILEREMINQAQRHLRRRPMVEADPERDARGEAARQLFDESDDDDAEQRQRRRPRLEEEVPERDARDVAGPGNRVDVVEPRWEGRRGWERIDDDEVPPELRELREVRRLARGGGREEPLEFNFEVEVEEIEVIGNVVRGENVMRQLEGFGNELLGILEGGQRRVAVTEEMIKKAQTLREKDESTPCTSRFSRACPICVMENPYERAVFTQCGHIVCYSCAVDSAKMADEDADLAAMVAELQRRREVIEQERVLLNEARRQPRRRPRVEAGQADPEGEARAEARLLFDDADHPVRRRARLDDEEGAPERDARDEARPVNRVDVMEPDWWERVDVDVEELRRLARGRGGIEDGRARPLAPLDPRVERGEGDGARGGLDDLIMGAVRQGIFEMDDPLLRLVRRRDVEGFAVEVNGELGGWQRRGGGAVTEEMIKEAQTLRAKDESTPCPSRFSRACPICVMENPYQRAVFTQCGHIVCYSCAVDNAKSEVIAGRCVFCRQKSSFVKLFEEEENDSDKKKNDGKDDNGSKTDDKDNE